MDTTGGEEFPQGLKAPLFLALNVGAKARLRQAGSDPLKSIYEIAWIAWLCWDAQFGNSQNGKADPSPATNILMGARGFGMPVSREARLSRQDVNRAI